MTQDHAQAFYDASGIHAHTLAGLARVSVGGIALICALVILIGLMQRIGVSDSPLEKMWLIVSIFVLAMILMLIFVYVA